MLFISIDQLRYQDLLGLAAELGPRGFAGLGRPAPMRYDAVCTETAADHATLSTGTYPDVHGVVANRWMEDGRVRSAVDDKSCPIWDREKGVSAAALRAPTVGDTLKLATAGHGRVVSVAMKDRVALLLGGASQDLALFWDGEAGVFSSTACYAKSAPDWLVAARAAHPLARWKDWVWTPSRPEAVLARYADPVAPGVKPSAGIGERFPHRVGHGSVDAKLFDALRSTPAGTTLTLETARAAVDALQLGDHGETDLLNLGLSAVDVIGHQFGTHSFERVDTLLRMHDELSAFVAALRARLGDRLSVVLAADHGLQPTPAEALKLRVPAGFIDEVALQARLEQTLTGILGGPAGKEGYVAFFDSPYLSLRRTAGIDPSRNIRLAAQALQQEEPGLYRVVQTADAAAEPLTYRHSIFPGRSGDLLLIPRPLWMFTAGGGDGASHGTPWNDDALIPFIVDARGFELRLDLRGHVLDATQAAPTLAAVLGIEPPAAAMSDSAVAWTGTK